jgi:hypothetical protein
VDTEEEPENQEKEEEDKHIKDEDTVNKIIIK